MRNLQFPETLKIGDPAWHLLNYETNRKNNTKHGLHFRTAEQAKRREKEREKLPERTERILPPKNFLPNDTRVRSIHSSAEKT